MAADRLVDGFAWPTSEITQILEKSVQKRKPEHSINARTKDKYHISSGRELSLGL